MQLTRRRGFTLIEALVAFAILTMALAQLLRSVGLGARNDMRADFLSRAARQGRAQLARVGVETPIVPGVTQGRWSDGVVWTQEIGGYGPSYKTLTGDTVAGYWVKLDMRSGPQTNDTITFNCVKIAVIRGAGL